MGEARDRSIIYNVSDAYVEYELPPALPTSPTSTATVPGQWLIGVSLSSAPALIYHMHGLGGAPISAAIVRWLMRCGGSRPGANCCPLPGRLPALGALR